jgi:hypothetical protein
MTYIVKVPSIKTDTGMKFKGDAISESDFNNKAVFKDLEKLIDKLIDKESKKTTKKEES